MTEREEGYHKGYNTAKAKYLAEMKELRNKYEHQIKDINSVYPLNLINDIYDEFDTDWDYSIKQIKKVMHERLTDRELTVLELRNGRNMTLEDVGKEFGVTRERIRQVEQKAIRKLRHPANLKRMSVVPYEEYARLEAENQDLKTKLEYAEKNALPAYEEKKIEDIRIEDLELSVRSFNCLRRVGIKTVGDIVNFSKTRGLEKCRNLGRKSLQEIADKLVTLGIDIQTGMEGETE